MRKAFISYRRDDSRDAARNLYLYLAPRLGENRIFMDVDDIAGGVEFPKVLDQELKQARVVLVVMGPRWLTIANAKGEPRLFDPLDFVRMEVRRALESGIAVIPVLLEGAILPAPEQLPEDLAGLAARQTRRVRHESFAADMNVLLGDIKQALREDPTVIRRRMMRWAGAGLAAATLATAAIFPEILSRPIKEMSSRIGAEWVSYRSDIANSGMKAEDAAWKTAQESNSLEAFRAYLRLYPLGANVAPARARIEELEQVQHRIQLAQLEAEKQREMALERDRTNREKAAHEAAIAKADNDAYLAASATGTRPAFEFYLQQFPTGRNAGEARNQVAGIMESEKRTQIAMMAAEEDRRRIESQRLEQMRQQEAARLAAETRRIEEAAQAARAQETARATEAERRLTEERARRNDERKAEAVRLAAEQDENAWRIAERANAQAAYAAYLQQFPEGTQASIARQRIASLETDKASAEDRAAWTRAQSLNTEASYRDYLARMPAGAMRRQAEALIAARQALARQWAGLRSSRSAKALAAFQAAAVGTEFETGAAARLAEIIDSEARDWALIQRASPLAALRQFAARWPEGNRSEEAQSRIRELEKAETLWATLQRSSDQQALEEFISEYGWTEFGAEATAELARLKQKTNDRSGIVYITADDMGELVDGAELRLPRAGYSIRISSKSNPPVRERLGNKALEKAFSERFLIEGGFRAVSLDDARAPAIEGIGGIIISRVDRTGSLFLLQMHGKERRMADVENGARKFASINIIRDRFGYVCAMSDWQLTTAASNPKKLVERCEVVKPETGR